MTLIETLCKISVEICCKDETDDSTGTGTIIVDKDAFYVMTAGHCIKKESNGTEFAYSDIKVISKAYSEPKEITVLKVVTCDLSEEKDYALLLIENPSVDFDFRNRVKRCDYIIDSEKYFFYGFTRHAQEGRLYYIQRCGKLEWNLENTTISNQPLTSLDLMSGNSGAGVFFVHCDVFYFIGYVKKLIDDNGTYNDIIVHLASNFENFLSESSKTSDFFELVEKWTSIEESQIDKELKDDYAKQNNSCIANLSRKMDTLFSRPQEAKEKCDEYLDYFFRGLQIDSSIKKENVIASKLNSIINHSLLEHKEERSNYFTNELAARKDLKDLKEKMNKAISPVFSTDKDGYLSKGYVNYIIADKLLSCLLDYQKDEL